MLLSCRASIDYQCQNQKSGLQILQSSKLQMEDKDDYSKYNEKESIRYRIFEVLSQIMLAFEGLPFWAETLFSVLLYLQSQKFAIDYFSKQWIGLEKPIFSYLDLFYIMRTAAPELSHSFFYVSVALMATYILLTISLYRPFSERFTRCVSVFLKVIYLFSTTLGFFPLIGTILNPLSCSSVNTAFWPCHPQYGRKASELIVGYSICLVFFLLLVLQRFTSFDFIFKENQKRTVRDSNYVPTLFMVYVLLNELLFMFAGVAVSEICLVLSNLVLLAVFFLKEENHILWSQRFELMSLAINLTTSLFVICKVALALPIELPFCLLAVVFVIIATLQTDLYSSKFELQNINKWNSPALMIRYCRSMRMLAQKTKKNIFQDVTLLHGYIDIHNQKCEIPSCPLRREVQDNEDKNVPTSLQLIYDLIKKIYQQGCSNSNARSDLQLEFCIFLYDIGEKNFALKNLLVLSQEDLSTENYYRYFILKKLVHFELSEHLKNECLDLVSELEVKEMQLSLMRQMENASLSSLQFWSVLNEDHPDYQKLDDVGTKSVNYCQSVRQIYEQICIFAHSQKMTSLFVHYLMAIENDESKYYEIHERVKTAYKLSEKIVLEDWSNSTLPTLIINCEDTNYGTIADLNSTCASCLGYEKYELINRNCQVLFPKMVRCQIDEFLNAQVDKNSNFYLLHKNEYLVKMTRRVQNYNSMETGMALLLVFELDITTTQGFFMMKGEERKIIGISASCISLFNFENKILDTYPTFSDVFTLEDQLMDMGMTSTSNCAFQKSDLFRINLIDKEAERKIGANNQHFSIKYEKINQENLDVLHLIMTKQKMSPNELVENIVPFEFHVEATLSDFKYVCEGSQSSNFLRQFSAFSDRQQVARVESYKDYAAQIVTLRLYENIIRVIEEENELDLASEKRFAKQRQLVEFQKIDRKDEDAIFADKETYYKFIQKQDIKMGLPCVILAALALNVAVYVCFYQGYKMQNHMTESYFNELTFENRITGAIAKTESYMQHYVQHNFSRSLRTPSHIPSKFLDNMIQLQSIRLNGSEPFGVPIFIDVNKTREVYILSDEFILSYTNYALEFIDKVRDLKTSKQIQGVLGSVDPFMLFFLIENGNKVRHFMENKVRQRQTQMEWDLASFKTKQIIATSAGIFGQLLFAVMVLAIVWKMQEIEVKLLSIFLQFGELQITKFSAKIEMLLQALHMEETAQTNTEESGSCNKGKAASYEKQKRFKVVKQSKCIYANMIIVFCITSLFYVHSFLLSYGNMGLMQSSLSYVDAISQGDQRIYDSLANYQKEFLGGQPQFESSAGKLRYYQSLFDLHYKTFGKIPSYHHYFIGVFMGPICVRGTFQIKHSCLSRYDELSPYGALIFITDLISQSQGRKQLIDFDSGYYTANDIVSQVHRNISNTLILQQAKIVKDINQQLLQSLLIWTFSVLGMILLFAAPIVNQLIKHINCKKNMMAFLPVSAARKSQGANYFIKKFTKNNFFL